MHEYHFIKGLFLTPLHTNIFIITSLTFMGLTRLIQVIRSLSFPILFLILRIEKSINSSIGRKSPLDDSMATHYQTQKRPVLRGGKKSIQPTTGQGKNNSKYC